MNLLKQKNKYAPGKKLAKSGAGFTLIELMVSLSIFSVVMLISMGSIVSVLDANKKSQSLRAVMDNLNSSLEGMTRNIRFGENYHCGSSGDVTEPLDCAGGESTLNLKLSNTSRATYKLISGRIARSINGGTDYYVTSPDVTIQDLKFRVFGSPHFSNGSDLYQPQVIIVIKGYAGAKPTTVSTFTLETTASQRKLDIQ